MQGNYISIAEFEQYKSNEATSALSVLDMNLRNENKLNQAAARMLGFSSYEAIEPMLAYERSIREGIVAEPSCPYQACRPVLRHKNILIVLDSQENRIFGRALNPGEERANIQHWNSTDQIELPRALDFFDQAPTDVTCKREDGNGFRYCATYTSKSTNKAIIIDAQATGEGIVLNVYRLLNDGDTEEVDSFGLMFTDALDETAETSVNQAALRYEAGEAAEDNVVYRWLKKVVDDYGSPRLLSIDAYDWKDDRLPPTELIFHSEAQARAFVSDNEFDYDEEDFEDLVLIRQTKTEV